MQKGATISTMSAMPKPSLPPGSPKVGINGYDITLLKIVHMEINKSLFVQLCHKNNKKYIQQYKNLIKVMDISKLGELPL